MEMLPARLGAAADGSETDSEAVRSRLPDGWHPQADQQAGTAAHDAEGRQASTRRAGFAP